MSEKTDLELQVDPSMHKAALQQNDANSRPVKKKNTSRSRLWKAFYIIECHVMAGILHGYAIAHAQKAHLARWDEVMVPDVENLVDWIKLFVVSPAMPQSFPVQDVRVSMALMYNLCRALAPSVVSPG